VKQKIILERDVCVCVVGVEGEGGRELTQRQLISLTFKSREPNANRGLTPHHGNKWLSLPRRGRSARARIDL